MRLEDVEAVKDVEVVAINDALDATPELVNDDPYGGGWLFELVPSDAGSVEALLDASGYQATLEG